MIRESIANRVECSDGGPVDVLVVADDEIVGQPIERPGPAGNRNDVLVHGRAPWLMVDFISCSDIRFVFIVATMKLLFHSVNT